MTVELGKWLIGIGLLMVIIGICLVTLGRIPLLDQLGNLPGDIHIEKGNTHIYIPLTTMLIVSIVLTLLFRLFTYFQN
jgi:uncharacterized membrane protein